MMLAKRPIGSRRHHPMPGIRCRGFVAACAALVGLAFASAALAVEPSETASVMPLAAANGHRLYVVDFNLPDLVDGRVHVIDGDRLNYLGVIPSGFTGLFAQAPKGDALYVVTSFYDRGTRGNRADVLETFDPVTLAYQSEILLPPLHAEAAPYPGLLNVTPDGTHALIQNATPETSVTLVDLAAGKVAGQIENAGCWNTYLPPGQNNRFATLCGDGTVLSIDFDATGKVVKHQQSAKLFDPEKDALFIQAIDTGNRFVFISFNGMVHALDITGESAVQDAPWSILPPAEAAKGWRPGGYQLLAYQKKTGILFVAMHQHGKEGSHKAPADEIWAIDLASHKLVDRIAGEKAVALVATEDGSPLLFALTDNGAIVKFATAPKLKKLGAMPGVAVTATELVLQ